MVAVGGRRAAWVAWLREMQCGMAVLPTYPLATEVVNQISPVSGRTVHPCAQPLVKDTAWWLRCIGEKGAVCVVVQLAPRHQCC